MTIPNLRPLTFFCSTPCRRPPSQRDGIIQPRVARNELPWVPSSCKFSTLQGLYQLLSMNTHALIYGAEERQEERAATLSGLMGLLFVSPRVARSSQPL